MYELQKHLGIATNPAIRLFSKISRPCTRRDRANHHAHTISSKVHSENLSQSSSNDMPRWRGHLQCIFLTFVRENSLSSFTTTGLSVDKKGKST
jgi:hypothetical protein